MAVRNIEACRIFICDGCKVEKESQHRPAYWTGLKIKAHAYDFQGVACADASTERLLCADCTGIVHEAINTAIEVRRGALSPDDGEGK